MYHGYFCTKYFLVDTSIYFVHVLFALLEPCFFSKGTTLSLLHFSFCFFFYSSLARYVGSDI